MVGGTRFSRLQDAFVFFKDDSSPGNRFPSSSNAGTSTDTSSAPSSRSSLCSGSGRTTYSDAQPISLRDFVRTKLANTNDPISVSIGLLCISLSLDQLRFGVDDGKLNISTTPAELADRITLGCGHDNSFSNLQARVLARLRCLAAPDDAWEDVCREQPIA